MAKDFWSERAVKYERERLAAERKQLEEAIQFGDFALDQGYRSGPDLVFINRGGLRNLVDAARKHLETLPKTKTVWRVRGEWPKTACIQSKSLAMNSLAEAAEKAREYIFDGAFSVSVCDYQVPA